MEIKNRTLSNFAELVRTGECKKFRGRLKVGVDLGTANTVLAVVDSTNRPIAGVSAPSHAIRDGVIVNYYESVQLVTKLKAELEEKLDTELPYAAAAIPPGVSEGSVKSIGYVLEGAGFEVMNIVDEPTAAAAVLKITDGAVVDVGGGTTGISILKDGKVIYTDDEATGGSHMTMTVAGHYKIPYEEAEVLKTTPEKEDEIFPVVKATIEKMATITEKFLNGYQVPAVYVVGGSASFREFTNVFEKKLKLPVYRPVHPLLVTPLGIAYNCELPPVSTEEKISRNANTDMSINLINVPVLFIYQMYPACFHQIFHEFTLIYVLQSLPSLLRSVVYHHGHGCKKDIHSFGRSWSGYANRIPGTHPSPVPGDRSHHSMPEKD